MSDRDDRYNHSLKGRARRKQHNDRRIRFGVGHSRTGTSYYLGVAPTLEDTARIRMKIREEAPRGLHS
jgi:hypothetical protein